MKSNSANATKVFCLITILGIFLSDACHAQIYAWKDPATAKSQMSSIPPPWYRGSVAQRNAGPRTVVTIGLEVLDDSAMLIDEIEYGHFRQRISSLSAPSRDGVSSTPPDVSRGAIEESRGPGDSTTIPALATRIEDAKRHRQEPLTAKEQAKIDEEEDREETAKQRGSPAR